MTIPIICYIRNIFFLVCKYSHCVIRSLQSILAACCWEHKSLFWNLFALHCFKVFFFFHLQMSVAHWVKWGFLLICKFATVMLLCLGPSSLCIMSDLIVSKIRWLISNILNWIDRYLLQFCLSKINNCLLGTRNRLPSANNSNLLLKYSQKLSAAITKLN